MVVPASRCGLEEKEVGCKDDRNERKFPVEGETRIGNSRLRALLAGVFLISFSLLAFEIALTRVLSVVLSYHYVFVVVSLA